MRRMCVVLGATIVAGHRSCSLLDAAPTWVTLIPTEDGSDTSGQASPPVWPRETYAMVSHEMHVGTIEELVEQYRQKLTAAAEECFDASEPTDSLFSVPDGFIPLPPASEPIRRNLKKRHETRNRMSGYETRQSAEERDQLMRIVASHGRVQKALECPSDNVDSIQRLIDALTVLKEDRLAMDQKIKAVALRRQTGNNLG